MTGAHASAPILITTLRHRCHGDTAGRHEATSLLRPRSTISYGTPKPPGQRLEVPAIGSPQGTGRRTRLAAGNHAAVPTHRHAQSTEETCITEITSPSGPSTPIPPARHDLARASRTVHEVKARTASYTRHEPPAGCVARQRLDGELDPSRVSAAQRRPRPWHLVIQARSPDTTDDATKAIPPEQPCRPAHPPTDLRPSSAGPIHDACRHTVNAIAPATATPSNSSAEARAAVSPI